MKCPVCGQKIEAGHLYCEKCGEEIRIVPDFEPEIENSINETLFNVAEQIEDPIPSEKVEEDDPVGDIDQKDVLSLNKEKQNVARITVIISTFIMLIVAVFAMYFNYSPTYQIKKAQKLLSSKHYSEAVLMLKKAQKSRKTDAQIPLLLSECYENMEDQKSALEVLLFAIDKNQIQEDDIEQVYQKVISIYEKNGDYDSINQLLLDCKVESIQTIFQSYMALPPTYSYEGGVYENMLYLRLSANTTGTIYYTLDGTVPNAGSIRYISPIQLEAGRYQINAVFINDYGIKSGVIRNLYVIDLTVPDKPEVEPASGTFQIPTMIEIDIPEDCKVYYSTDKSNPDENSKEYTEPIQIPIGRSNYKFIIISKDGVKSDITSRSYEFALNTTVTIDMATQRIMQSLVERGVLLNTKGDLPEGGKSRFAYNTVVQIGESYYYIFNEYTTTSGIEKKEERMYAVEVYSGTPNRLTINDGVMGLIPLT